MSDRGNRCQLFIVARGKNAMRTTNPSLAETLCRARLRRAGLPAYDKSGTLVVLITIRCTRSRAAFENNDFRRGPVNVDVILRRLYRFGFADGGTRRNAKRTKSLLIGHDLALLHTRMRADMHLIRLGKLDRKLKLLPRSLRRHAETRTDMYERAPTYRCRVCIYFGGKQ